MQRNSTCKGVECKDLIWRRFYKVFFLVFFFFLILQLKQRLSTSGNFQNECSNSQRWFLKSILMYTKTKRKQFSNKSNFQNGVLTLNQMNSMPTWPSVIFFISLFWWKLVRQMILGHPSWKWIPLQTCFWKISSFK